MKRPATRRLAIFRLEAWIVALLLLCQGVQALHCHASLSPHPSPPGVCAVEPLRLQSSDEMSCMVCWATQAVQQGPAAVVGLGELAVALKAPAPPARAVLTPWSLSPGAPRGPPTV